MNGDLQYVQTIKIPPRIHNFVRLLDLAGLASEAGPEIVGTLAKMNAFQMEGRYPELAITPPGREDAVLYMKGAQEVRA